MPPAAPAAPAPAAAPAAAPKPAAAPAAPAPPKPAAPARGGPAPNPEPDPRHYMSEEAAELDALNEIEDARAEGRTPKPAKAKDQTPPNQNAEPKGKTENEELDELGRDEQVQPQDKGAKPDSGKPAAEPEPKSFPELRTGYRELKKWRSENEPKLATLEARVKELEHSNPPEVKAMQARLEAAEKRNAELEGHMAHVDYSKSKEFQEKFVKPYNDAWAQAVADLSELDVELPDGNSRKATEEDLMKLAQLPLGEARRQANAMFGDSADDMMAHRREILRLSRAQSEALTKARETAQERLKTAETDSKAIQERTEKLWDECNQEIMSRWGKTFDKVDGDAEGNAKLEKGLAIANRIFRPTDETRPKTLEEKTALFAMAYQKIANFDRMVFWYQKAQSRIKELEAEVQQYHDSEPNGGLSRSPRGGGGGNGNPTDEAFAELESLDRADVV